MPSRQFEDQRKPWLEKEQARRRALAGKPFAGGLCLLFSEYIGDWEWRVSAFRWRGSWGSFSERLLDKFSSFFWGGGLS